MPMKKIKVAVVHREKINCVWNVAPRQARGSLRVVPRSRNNKKPRTRG